MSFPKDLADINVISWMNNIKQFKNEEKKFKVVHTKILKPPNAIVNSLEFHFEEDKLIYSIPDKKIHFVTFNESLSVFKNYKINLHQSLDIVKLVDKEHVAYTSSSDCLIKSVNINVNSLKKSNIGSHDGKVNSIAIYGNDLILSSSDDKTVKLWDRRKTSEVFKLNVGESPLVAFHPSGALFAVASDSHVLEVYQLAELSEPIFKKNLIEDDKTVWKSLKYSPSGTFIVITTNCQLMFIVDSTDGNVLHTLNDYENVDGENIDVTFDNFKIYYGSSNGIIHMRDLKKNSTLDPLKLGNTSRKVTRVDFSPKRSLLASAGNNFLELWKMSI